MKSDVQIAAEAKLKPISAIAAKLGISAKYIEAGATLGIEHPIEMPLVMLGR